MKLLLIEDNQQLAHWLEQILKEHKFSVDIAADGEIAEDTLQELAPAGARLVQGLGDTDEERVRGRQ